MNQKEGKWLVKRENGWKCRKMIGIKKIVVNEGKWMIKNENVW